MKIAVLGTGMVGQALARKLVDLDHDVTMGSRTADNENAATFARETGGKAGTFADAAAGADLIVVATNGAATLNALDLAGPASIEGKIVIDVSNPLDFSAGFPPTFIPELNNTTSLGEAVQSAYPGARVVKALNTVNCEIMVAPDRLAEPSDIFVSGNDADAKAEVVALLESFGWKNPVDLGDITTARGTEQYLALWIRLTGPAGGAHFNIRIVK